MATMFLNVTTAISGQKYALAKLGDTYLRVLRRRLVNIHGQGRR
jgi:hypothetical protein